MSYPPELLALGILILFGIIVFLMIRTSRREQNEQDHQLRQLGFEPLEDAPLELESRVEELYQTRRGREIKLWRVFKRRESDQDLYLFDAEDTRGESSELGSEIFGLISNQLALPHFSLVTLPEFDRGSLFGGLIDKILDRVMSYAEGHLGLQRIEFPNQPELDDQLILFGQDPDAVREMLDSVGLNTFRSTQLPVQIAGKGDFLTVDFSTPSDLNQPGKDLVSRYQTFSQITRAFME